jgi:CheY-like chemotaxis protein
VPTVFLVEDNAADVDLFRMALADACVDCDLVVFEDGSDLVDYVRRHRGETDGCMPDLVILDLNLPKIGGLEVLQMIRQEPDYQKVRIAVLSSSPSVRERDKLVSFQISEFITKPPDLDKYLEIGKTVRKLLDEAGKPNVSVS